MTALDIGALERACYGKAGDRVGAIVSAANVLATGSVEGDTAARRATYTRIADAVGAVLADPAFKPSLAELVALLCAKPVLSNVFAASRHAGADHLWPEAGAGRMALLSPDTALEADLAAELREAGALGLLAALGVAATLPLLTQRGERRRDSLLASAERLPSRQLPATMSALGLATAAWMMSSYASGPDKHAIKAVLNEVYQALLQAWGFAAAPPPVDPRPRAKPTLVVCAEVMNSGHVQYRYYAQYLRQLRTRFDLVLVTAAREVDAAVRDLFDDVAPFSEGARGEHVAAIVGAVRAAAPDIIFWPSLGMGHWGPLVANLRLAPIQIAGIGHPATTLIPAIDYMLLERGFVDGAEGFSERLLLLPDEALRLERSPGHVAPQPLVRERPDVVRIALPCSLLKLNPTFVAVLGRIRESATRPVQYHLFPNATRLQTDAFLAAAGPLGDCVLHPKLSPAAYLEGLNACDLALSSFPFGGFHTMVDCLGQGLPVVAMDSPDNAVKTDRMLLNGLGLPPKLVAKTEAEYEAAALKLIEDDAARVKLSHEILALDLEGRLFASPPGAAGQDVAELVWAAYRNHAAIQASPRRAFHLADLQAMATGQGDAQAAEAISESTIR